MPRRLLIAAFFLALLPTTPATLAQAPGDAPRSGGKAFLLSLALPGLGHRYVQHGDWSGTPTLFTAADAGLWLGLLGTSQRLAHLTESYQTLAASGAGAQTAGKERSFYLNLASYHSSDEYLEVQLRDRAWDQLDYVDDRAFQWEWTSEADFQRFRTLREDAESMRRRRPLLIALLAANRLASGITAVRAAGRANDAPATTLSLSAPPPEGAWPVLNLRVGF